jgi:hypothetical protein
MVSRMNPALIERRYSSDGGAEQPGIADLAGYTFNLQMFAGPLSVIAVQHKHSKQAAAFLAVIQMQPFFVSQLRPFLGHFKKMFLNEMHNSSHLSKTAFMAAPFLTRLECRNLSA